jgi:hypothetical protein
VGRASALHVAAGQKLRRREKRNLSLGLTLR